MNRIENFFSHLRRPVQNESGMAALLGVVFVIILLAAVSASFISESQQKQSSAALTHTSDNAFSIAEAGLRMMERCMQEDDAACICNTSAPFGCLDWVQPANTFGPYNNIAFSGGTLDLSFSNRLDFEATVTCVGKSQGAERVASKTVTLTIPACSLSANTVTTCDLTQEGGVTLTGTTVDLDNTSSHCPNPTLVGDPPNPPDGPNFDNDCADFAGTPTGADLDYNKFDMDGNTTCTINGPQTITVDDNFKIKDTAKLIINGGDVVFEIWKDADFEDSASVELTNGATLKFHVRDDIVVKDNALINVVDGDSADLLFMAKDNFTIQHDAQFVGAALSQDKVKVEDDAIFTGIMFGQDAELKDSANVTIDQFAGIGIPGFFLGVNQTGCP